MADIAAGDVTYTVQESTQGVDGASNWTAVYKVEFGDGTLTYPSGGVPLTKAKLGCPAHVKAISLLDANDASGLVVKLDYAGLKVRLYEGDFAGTADAALVELDSGSDAPAAQVLYVEVKGY